MEVRDARRLTGPHLVWDRPCAVVEVGFEDGEDREAAIAAWEEALRPVVEALGLEAGDVRVRHHARGATLALDVPIEFLYPGVEAVEWAAHAAAAGLAGREPDESREALLARVREEWSLQPDRKLRALRERAAREGLPFLWDDDLVTVGAGAGSRTWPRETLPEVDEVPWEELHGVPVALVTGTNGKTTTVRMLARILTEAGHVVGTSTTDWVAVGDDVLDRDDWSGPGGARMVLRDRRVTAAVLETARGGMLRRGLGVEDADVGVLTNVAPDHLGEWGVWDVAELADVKCTLARAARRLVVNAEDDLLAERALASGRPLTWFALRPGHPRLVAARERGEAVAYRDGDALVWEEGPASARRRVEVLRADAVPASYGGAMGFVLANALAALGAARALGLEWEPIRAGLRDFHADPERHPGRLNLFELGGVRVLVDFAHNPHGLAALLAAAHGFGARRLLLTLGHAGDRSDEDCRELGATAAAGRPDLVVLMERPAYLRGRPLGEIPELLAEGLERGGLSRERTRYAASELEAARVALAEAGEGDLVLLLPAGERREVLDWLQGLRESEWRPGTPLPSLPAGAGA